VNGGDGFVGRLHPSHPFTTPHPTVSETPWTAQKSLTDEIAMFAR